MSITSGVKLSKDLLETWKDGETTRFMKVIIFNETTFEVGGLLTVHDEFEEDLKILPTLTDDNIPSVLLVRLDIAGRPAIASDRWLWINYMPVHASRRLQMLYSSSERILKDALGSQKFVATLRIDSQDNLIKSILDEISRDTAPKPQSSREVELDEIRAAEREHTEQQQAANKARSHLTGVDLLWQPSVTTAVREFIHNYSGNRNFLVFEIGASSGYLELVSEEELHISELWATVPNKTPFFALMEFKHYLEGEPRERCYDIVFIYCCPPDCTVKQRMLYSTGSASVFKRLKELMQETADFKITKKIETSSISELDEKSLLVALHPPQTQPSGEKGNALASNEGRAFAKPRAPGRRR